MKAFHAQIEQDAIELATELHRLQNLHKDRTTEDQVRFASWDIRALLFRYEGLLEAAIEKIKRKPSSCSYTDFARAKYRSRNISSRNGAGFGCTICYASDEPTFLTLTIGNVYGNLLLDLCRPCAERLLNVTEARFEDKRRRDII